ncbi:MAG: EutN/CcmL family microcompartment protein [Anaerolineae bacterium]|nr:EutN/CcmL family microcompartment protein [Anaerolineae bacterium]
MFIAEVIGSVVASRKTENMDGLPLRIVRKVSPDRQETDVYQVAVDVIGASEGEYVLIATGSTARQTTLTDARPCDALIMAIVDTWQLNGSVLYTKSEEPIPTAPSP